MPPIKELAQLTREGNFELVKSKLNELITTKKYTPEEIVNQPEEDTGSTLLFTAALHRRLDILEYFLLLTNNEPPFIFRPNEDLDFLSVLAANGEINKLSADSVAVIKKTFPDFDAAKPASWQSILSIRAELLGPLVERVGAFQFTKLYLAHIGYEPKGPEWQSATQPPVINKPLN